ncbi:DUF2946 domain-containing protein [Pseudomonas sp. CBSPCGW29]|nr:DUF2946 domain-containing protein [Pseudomonas sp. CBSPCGW29]
MARQRFAIAWIACLAVLFNAFAMPLASAMQQADDPVKQLLWGSFCSSNGTKLTAIALGKLEIPAPQQDDHSTMQHCWCCSGSAPLVALPGHSPTTVFRKIRRGARPAAAVVAIPHPAPAMAEPQPPRLSNGLISSQVNCV